MDIVEQKKGRTWVKLTASTAARSNRVRIGKARVTGKVILLYGSTSTVYHGVLEVYDARLCSEGFAPPSTPTEPGGRGLLDQWRFVGSTPYTSFQTMTERKSDMGEVSFYNTHTSTATLWVEIEGM